MQKGRTTALVKPFSPIQKVPVPLSDECFQAEGRRGGLEAARLGAAIALKHNS
jgi:hypothetical protein